MPPDRVARNRPERRTSMYDYALYGSRVSTLGTLGIIAILLAIIATVLA